MFDVEPEVSPEWLERQLVATEMLISQLRTRQAELVQRAGEIQAHTRDGAASLQEWLRGRLDVGASTAQNLVAVSTALSEFVPVRIMADDRESFDRIVATVALCAAGATAQIVESSRDHDVAGVRRIANRQRRMSPRSERDVFVDRHVVLQDSFDGSRGRVAADLPGFEYTIVGRALSDRADRFNELPGPRIPRAARMADALVSIAQDSLHVSDPHHDARGGSEPLVTVLVDADLAGQTHGEAGVEVAYGPRVGPTTLERILCDGAVQPSAWPGGDRSLPPMPRRRSRRRCDGS